MPFLQSVDKPTRTSFLAVIICVVGSIAGLSVARFIDAVSDIGYLPIGLFSTTIFGLLGGFWLMQFRTQAYDLSATFVTYILTVIASLWIIRFFFIDPAIGPFAEQLWTVPNALANATFGVCLFALIGMSMGMTYFTARRTHDDVCLRRGLIAFIGIGAPIYLLAKAEYFLTQFQI